MQRCKVSWYLTVEPRHRDGLKEYGGEEGEAGGVALEQVEHVETAL